MPASRLLRLQHDICLLLAASCDAEEKRFNFLTEMPFRYTCPLQRPYLNPITQKDNVYEID